MMRIGLTGGIGSGKSTVADLLISHANSHPDLTLEVVDADGIARDIVEPGQPALAELAEAFGSDIVDADGRLRRRRLAELAFATPEQTAVLNSITHPRIAEETAQRFEDAESRGVDAVVYDMPLLVDKGYHRDMDLVVVVDVDAEERVRRLVAHRGLDESDARKRIDAQIPDAERLAAADIIIDNNGAPEALGSQVDALIKRIAPTTTPAEGSGPFDNEHARELLQDLREDALDVTMLLPDVGQQHIDEEQGAIVVALSHIAAGNVPEGLGDADVDKLREPEIKERLRQSLDAVLSDATVSGLYEHWQGQAGDGLHEWKAQCWVDLS